MYQLAALLESFKMRLRNDEGATAVEYGLMVALIAVVVAVGAALLGKNVNSLFNSIAGTIN